MIAWWQINEDDEDLSLQIELGSNRVWQICCYSFARTLRATSRKI
jgi:hypothetical protein